jgi:valyl-tRNA synthetase
MTIPAQFDKTIEENKALTGWKQLFHSEPDHRTPYTIVIPPPNDWSLAHGTYVKQYHSRCFDSSCTS